MTYTVDLFSAQLEQIQKELKNSRAELDRSISPGLFDHLLVNDDLETWYEKFEGNSCRSLLPCLTFLQCKIPIMILIFSE
jgi:hypothetical protein